MAGEEQPTAVPVRPRPPFSALFGGFLFALSLSLSLRHGLVLPGLEIIVLVPPGLESSRLSVLVLPGWESSRLPGCRAGLGVLQTGRGVLAERASGCGRGGWAWDGLFLTQALAVGCISRLLLPVFWSCVPASLIAWHVPVRGDPNSRLQAGTLSDICLLCRRKENPTYPSAPTRRHLPKLQPPFLRTAPLPPSSPSSCFPHPAGRPASMAIRGHMPAPAVSGTLKWQGKG